MAREGSSVAVPSKVALLAARPAGSVTVTVQLAIPVAVVVTGQWAVPAVRVTG